MGASTALLNSIFQKGISERYNRFSGYQYAPYQSEQFWIRLTRRDLQVYGVGPWMHEYSTQIMWGGHNVSEWDLLGVGDNIWTSFLGSDKSNWPPGNYPSSTSSTQGNAAYEDGYAFPDWSFETFTNKDAYINTIAYPSTPDNKVGDSAIQGTHYFTGTYKFFENHEVDVEGLGKVRWNHWYYSVKQSYSPPSYYRNSLALDDSYADSGDGDFNDFIIRSDGDCYFKGPVVKITAGASSPTAENRVLGSSTEQWAMFDDFKFVVNKAIQITFSTTRKAGYCLKLLLWKDSSNYTTLISPGGGVNVLVGANYTRTLNPGTYEVGVLRSTDSTVSGSCDNVAYEASTSPRIWVRNIDLNLPNSREP